MNLDFDVRCIRSNPQAGICEVSFGGGGSSSPTGPVVNATVRGGTFIDPMSPNNYDFQMLTPPATLTRVDFGVVVNDPDLLWDAGNFRYTIPVGGAGNYLLSFGLCTNNSLNSSIPLPSPTNQIFQFSGFFRVLNPGGTTKEDVGKASAYGGVSSTLNDIFSLNNLSDVLAINSRIIIPLLDGEHIQVFTIFEVEASNSVITTSLPLIDPAASPTFPDGVMSAWFSIKRV